MIGKPMIDLKNIIMTGYISEAIASKANGMKWGEVVLSHALHAYYFMQVLKKCAD